MLRITKALTLLLFASAILVALPSMAGASTILYLQQDAGPLTMVASGPSLSSLLYSGTTGVFKIDFLGSVADNTSFSSDILSSTTSVTNTSNATHTLTIYQTSDGYTLPVGPDLIVESGMSGTVNSGTVIAIFQAYADASNAENGILDYSNGLQTASLNGSTFDTGSASGTFTRGAGAYSLTTVTTLNLSGNGKANYSTHENVNVPEPQSLVLLGTGLIGLAGMGFKRKKSRS